MEEGVIAVVAERPGPAAERSPSVDARDEVGDDVWALVGRALLETELGQQRGDLHRRRLGMQTPEFHALRP